MTKAWMMTTNRMLMLLALTATSFLAYSQPITDSGLAVNPQTPATRETIMPEATPLALVPAEELHAFEPGDFVESIAIDSEGILYATIIRLQGTNEIWRMLPDGRSGTFVTLAGVGTISVDAEGNLYATVTNFDLQNPEAVEPASLWRITPEGSTEKLVTLPQGAQPNGSTLDAAGHLYVADSALGKIWLLPEGKSDIETWLEHDLLRPQGQPGFPGANGLKFFGGALYASNSSTGSIVRIPVGAGGVAGEPTVHATGVPTDDFAFDRLGNLYATTHPFDTVVRIKPDGGKETVATVEQGVIGPTAAVFGTQPDTTDRLYVVTDGGLFGSLSA
jgi:sugar lactone lactonase YvrE